jgi:hypothetical protein
VKKNFIADVLSYAILIDQGNVRIAHSDAIILAGLILGVGGNGRSLLPPAGSAL